MDNLLEFCAVKYFEKPVVKYLNAFVHVCKCKTLSKKDNKDFKMPTLKKESVEDAYQIIKDDIFFSPESHSDVTESDKEDSPVVAPTLLNLQENIFIYLFELITQGTKISPIL